MRKNTIAEIILTYSQQILILIWCMHTSLGVIFIINLKNTYIYIYE